MDQGPEVKSDPRRALPGVDRLLEALREARPELPRWAAAEGARRALAAERARLAEADEGPVAGEDTLMRRSARLAAALCAARPARVVNATGIVLHTNLGRAPLAAGAVAAVAEAAAGYSDLELDLASGRRGQRLSAVREKLALLSGAEAGLAVNNNAAAVMLALDTLGRGREVVVSRGELVEIGGSFRVPDIMERAGVRLVEVGTTNRTHLSDYERAIGPETALLLKVHRSNFQVSGFVAEVGLGELAGLAASHGLPVVEDLGSGTLFDLPKHGFPAETDARSRLRQGADLVCFSGDKILGGPQAGLVIGRADLVDAMGRNPLARALRLDKLSLAALDWTLAALLDGRAERELPVLRQLLAAPAALESRARDLLERLSKVASGTAELAVEPDRALVGGGSLPGFELETWVVTLRTARGAQELARRLRQGPVPVLARVRDDCVVLDVRSLLEDDSADLEAALRAALHDPPR